ncbi:MAG: hypothetical protein ABIQ16_17345 [Polyangiaceae bacterium]
MSARLACAALLFLSSAAPSLAGCARPSLAPKPTPAVPAFSATPADASPATISVPAIVEQRVEALGIDYVFRASRLTNLAWQLDCLAGFGRCSQPAYEALWRDRLQTDPDLHAALARWGDLRRQLRGPVGERLESHSLLPLPQRKADLWQRVRLASVTAVTEAQYRSELSALTDPESAAALGAVVARFDLAFSTIWEQAVPVLQRAMSEQAALQRRADVALTVRRVAGFYGGSSTPPIMRFDLLYRPEHPSADFATQLLDHGLIEVVATAKPELRIQPPVHEMFHYLFASAPFQKLDDLASRFAASPDPQALAAYGLLDEVLATGLAQGVLGRELAPAELEARLAAPRKLYDDPFVDAVTKAFLPELGALLQKSGADRTVFSAEFQAAYLGAVKSAFPRGLPPAADLRPFACAYSKDLEKAYQALRVASGSQLVGSSDQPDDEDTRALLEGHPTWGRVLLLKPNELSALRRYGKSLTPTAVALLRANARRNDRFAYATRASGAGPVFVLVADSDEHAQKLITEFMHLPTMFSGLTLAHPRTGT